MSDMRVAAVQFHPEFGRVEDNIRRVSSMIRDTRADLYVLPELCFTGYAFRSKQEAMDLAESVSDSFSLNHIRELASEHKCGIIYGFAELSGEKVYNSCCFVSPDGGHYIYRKLHLYYQEKEWFSPGDKPLGLVEFRGCRIGMMICFDWIFPEVARSLALMGAHLICHPSNLVMRYCQTTMVTRCVENTVFAVTANRIGRETRGEYDFDFTGGSQILSVRGDILYDGSRDKEEIGIADINFRESEDKRINPKNDLWNDRRPEFYRVN